MQARPLPKPATSRLYGVYRDTHFKLPGTNRCIIWGREETAGGYMPVPDLPTRTPRLGRDQYHKTVTDHMLIIRQSLIIASSLRGLEEILVIVM